MKITRSEFDQMLEAAIAALPPAFAQWLDEIPIIVDDEPSREMLKEMGVDEEGDLLGSYNGVSLTQRGVEDSARLPEQIHIFRKPLIAMCDTREVLALEIRKTLLHELGHYAGLDEEDLENLGYG